MWFSSPRILSSCSTHTRVCILILSVHRWRDAGNWRWWQSWLLLIYIGTSSIDIYSFSEMSNNHDHSSISSSRYTVAIFVQSSHREIYGHVHMCNLRSHIWCRPQSLYQSISLWWSMSCSYLLYVRRLIRRSLQFFVCLCAFYIHVHVFDVSSCAWVAASCRLGWPTENGQGWWWSPCRGRRPRRAQQLSGVQLTSTSCFRLLIKRPSTQVEWYHAPDIVHCLRNRRQSNRETANCASHVRR